MTVTTKDETREIFDIIIQAEDDATGEFSAYFARAVAVRLTSKGYSLVPEGNAASDPDELFEIVATVEQEQTGVFTATTARKIAKALSARVFQHKG